MASIGRFTEMEFHLPSKLPGLSVKFTPEELPMKEVQFAESYGLEVQQYCDLKTHIYQQLGDEARSSVMKDALVEARKTVKEEVKRELLPSLKEEAVANSMAEALKKAKAELEPKLRKELLENSKKVYESELLTKEDKEAYADAFRDAEVEALLFASAASHEADEVHQRNQQSKNASKWTARVMGVAAFPIALFLFQKYTAHSPAFYLLLAPVILCFLTAFFNGYKQEDSKEVARLKKLASDYLMIVSRCRTGRKLSIHTKLRSEVLYECSSVQNSKAELDRVYHPVVRVLDEVRPAVRHRLAEDLDPEEILSQEFDDRLSQAESKQSPTA